MISGLPLLLRPRGCQGGVGTNKASQPPVPAQELELALPPRNIWLPPSVPRQNRGTLVAAHQRSWWPAHAAVGRAGFCANVHSAEPRARVASRRPSRWDPFSAFTAELKRAQCDNAGRACRITYRLSRQSRRGREGSTSWQSRIEQAEGHPLVQSRRQAERLPKERVAGTTVKKELPAACPES